MLDYNGIRPRVLIIFYFDLINVDYGAGNALGLDHAKKFSDHRFVKALTLTA